MALVKFGYRDKWREIQIIVMLFMHVRGRIFGAGSDFSKTWSISQEYQWVWLQIW